MQWLQLRFDYDLTTMYRTCLLAFNAIRTKQKMNMSFFHRSRIAAESNAYCNFDHFHHSRMRCGIVVSYQGWSNRNCDIGLRPHSFLWSARFLLDAISVKALMEYDPKWKHLLPHIKTNYISRHTCLFQQQTRIITHQKFSIRRYSQTKNMWCVPSWLFFTALRTSRYNMYFFASFNTPWKTYQNQSSVTFWCKKKRKSQN